MTPPLLTDAQWQEALDRFAVRKYFQEQYAARSVAVSSAGAPSYNAEAPSYNLVRKMTARSTIPTEGQVTVTDGIRGVIARIRWRLECTWHVFLGRAIASGVEVRDGELVTGGPTIVDRFILGGPPPENLSFIINRVFIDRRGK